LIGYAIGVSLDATRTGGTYAVNGLLVGILVGWALGEVLGRLSEPKADPPTQSSTDERPPAMQARLAEARTPAAVVRGPEVGKPRDETHSRGEFAGYFAVFFVLFCLLLYGAATLDDHHHGFLTGLLGLAAAVIGACALTALVGVVAPRAASRWLDRD
jgi:hypothetical protein